MLNNLLSCYTYCDSDILLIENCYKRISSLQRESQEHNYFPHRRMCEYYRNILNREIQKPSVSLNEQRDVFKCFKTCLEKYEKDFEICREN